MFKTNNGNLDKVIANLKADSNSALELIEQEIEKDPESDMVPRLEKLVLALSKVIDAVMDPDEE